MALFTFNDGSNSLNNTAIENFINKFNEKLKGELKYTCKDIDGYLFFLGKSELNQCDYSMRYFSIVSYDGHILLHRSNVIDKDAKIDLETYTINPYKYRLKVQADKFLV